MRYDTGTIGKRIRWVKMDGRNKMVQHWSHRITVRDRLTGLKIEKWFVENFDIKPFTFHDWEPKYGTTFTEGLYVKPRIYKQRETYTRSSFYLNEEDLVQFVVGFEP